MNQRLRSALRNVFVSRIDLEEPGPLFSATSNLPRRGVRVAAALAACFGTLATAAYAMPFQSRIKGAIENGSRVTLAGTRTLRARAANDRGVVAPSTELQGMSLIFSRSQAQEADLQALLDAQQNPASPQYHQWLTPAEFTARFGLDDADLAKVQSWLQSQGFAVTGVSNSHDRIYFTGTAQQVAAAFGTELHRYAHNGQTRIAPAADISVPAALSTVVRTLANVSTYRPHPHMVVKPTTKFTSSQSSGSHFLTPGDVSTIYDVKPAYNAGYNGAGQSIAVVGQSAVLSADITNFQTAAGVAVKAPTMVLMPGTGSSTVYSGDESESDLDLEYTSGMAPGATIYFVYTGSSKNYSVFDALQYAVDTDIAPIISVSYGDCEQDLGSSNYSGLNAVLQQAAAQGQTVVAAAGDDGSTDCYADTNQQTTVREQVAVDFPADSQFVTGMGGTMFSPSAIASGSPYWSGSSGTDVISSAASYIPEQVWNNDDSSYGLSSGGGGISIYTPRPSWQAGVNGISSGSYRLVPDISLAASPDSPGYLYCSSDTQSTGVTGSCSHGFRDVNDTYLTVAGGTSFAAPVFAGMLAVLNQKINATAGQGNINPILYSLASNPTTYASAFHDVTTGSNACTAGATYCSTAGAGSYVATVGYDEATGLGSVDFNNLLTAWPTNTSSTSTQASSSTSVTAAAAGVSSGSTDIITIKVASTTSTATATPTGTVSVSVDGSVVNSSLALNNGTATYSFSSTTAGSHTITASYSGDSNYASSTGTVSVSVNTASFQLTGSAMSASSGSPATSTITVTPNSGYTGTVKFTVTANTALANACYTLPNATITGTSAVSSTLTIYTSASACSSANGAITLQNGTGVQASNRSPGIPGNHHLPEEFAFAGLLAIGFSRRKLRTVRGMQPLLAIGLLGVIGMTMTGCGGNASMASGNSSSSTTTTNANAAKGTYTLTIVGTDSASSALTSMTTVSLTIN